ncbi:hypothetical protein TNCV_4811 [Trichonephila clavipes]|nr:hypothetical protein TNCV_4811 [Trichonephila clavipes]
MEREEAMKNMIEYWVAKIESLRSTGLLTMELQTQSDNVDISDGTSMFTQNHSLDKAQGLKWAISEHFQKKQSSWEAIRDSYRLQLAACWKKFLFKRGKGQGIEPSTTKDPPCWGAMHVKSVESSNVLPLVWCGS